MKYEMFKSDPFHHGHKAATRKVSKAKQIDRLKGRPVLLEPVLNLLFLGVHKAYWTLFRALSYVGHQIDAELRALANIN